MSKGYDIKIFRLVRLLPHVLKFYKLAGNVRIYSISCGRSDINIQMEYDSDVVARLYKYSISIDPNGFVKILILRKKYGITICLT